ncbi:MAG: hypothetical protein HWE14_13040 [Flavobacteriia bacterium]|nr:hypothetical protein [Flavobacteriia bacterium]
MSGGLGFGLSFSILSVGIKESISLTDEQAGELGHFNRWKLKNIQENGDGGYSATAYSSDSPEGVQVQSDVNQANWYSPEYLEQAKAVEEL